MTQHYADVLLFVDLGTASMRYFAGFHAYGWSVAYLWGEVHACVYTGVYDGADTASDLRSMTCVPVFQERVVHIFSVPI